MTLSITLPQLNSKSNNTKDVIITILSEEWPLSAKEIYSRVLRQSKRPVSYQAIHKMIQFLLDEEIVVKTGKAYALRPSWIDNVKRFADSLEKRYGEDKREDFMHKFENFKDSMKFTFDDISEFSVSMAYMLLNDRVVTNYDRTYRIGCVRHGWWPFAFNFDHFTLLRKISKIYAKPYVIIHHNSPFGEWINKQYNLAGFKSKIILGLEEPYDDVLIAGNLILQVNYSNRTKKIIDRIYERNSGITSLFKEFVKQKVSNNKANISLKILEDSALATTLGKHYMEIWRNAK